MDLISNNTTANLIAFVQKGNEQFYCLAEVEYWIVEWWDGYVDLSNGSLEDLYFEYLNRFKLNYCELREAYGKLRDLGEQFKLDGNKPSLFIDFDRKVLLSNFYDQALEKRIPNDWEGVFGKVEESIPEKYKYWKTKDL